MALRDQPYLPLYVQDVLTDEKLIECSIEAHGLYFRLLCILHKQEYYGKLILKEKYKSTGNKFDNFANMLIKQLPFSFDSIKKSLIELADEEVILIDDNELSQKRMLKDGEISLVRSEVGKKGGSNITKQYKKPGYLYFMSDFDELNKIGISVNPQNRLYRIRSDHNLKNFEIIDVIEVKDMGKAEDYALNFLKDKIDGEWIKEKYEIMVNKFALLKANIQANFKANAVTNSEYENENENENENDIDINSIIDTWNFFATKYQLASIIKLTDKRKSNIKQRLKEKDFNFEAILRESEKSDFLLGRKTDWKIDFDFIIGSKNNYVKILEGKYRNSKNEQKGKFNSTEAGIIDITKARFNRQTGAERN